MSLPSASKLDLAERCTYPWTSGMRWARWGSDAAATVGMRVHAAAHELATTGEVDLSGMASDVVEAVGRVAEVLDADQVLGSQLLASEVRFGLDERGRARLVDKREPPAGWEMRGDVDLVLRRGDVLVIRDWKTGRTARRSRPADSLQLLYYAACASQIWGPVDRVVLELAHVGESLWVDSAELDVLDVGAALGRIMRLRARVGRPSLPVLGAHCRSQYCPIASTCPAAAALAAEALSVAALPASQDVADDLTAGEVLQRLPLARAYLDVLQTAAEEYVSRTGTITARDGTRYALVEHDGAERLRLTDAAHALLEARGLGSAVEVERTASKASLERVERARGGSRGIGKRLAPVLDELRAMGALQRGGSWARVEEVD